MIKNLITTILLLLSQIGPIEPEYVTIRTQRFSFLPYEFSLQIPEDYKEIECYRMSGQPLEIHITFSNGGYVYLSQQDYIPNTGRIRSLGKDIYYKRFGFLTRKPSDIYNPDGKKLVLFNNEGKDSDGLYWRDVHYIFPDSICYTCRNGVLVQEIKDRRFRLSVGYSNVPRKERKNFNKIIDSMRLSSVGETDDGAVMIDTTWIHINTNNPRIRRLCEMPSVEEIQKR